MNREAGNREKPMSRIGRGTCIEGTVEAEHGVEVEGVIAGGVRCKGEVKVLPGGCVRGEVVCRVLLNEGEVQGNVDALEAVLRAGSAIRGYLLAERVEVSGGVHIGKGLRFKPMSK